MQMLLTIVLVVVSLLFATGQELVEKVNTASSRLKPAKGLQSSGLVGRWYQVYASKLPLEVQKGGYCAVADISEVTSADSSQTTFAVNVSLK